MIYRMEFTEAQRRANMMLSMRVDKAHDAFNAERQGRPGCLMKVLPWPDKQVYEVRCPNGDPFGLELEDALARLAHL